MALTKEQAAEKLKKIKALSEGGVGGEKEGARKIYEELKRKYGISEEEMEEWRQDEPEEEETAGIKITLAFLARNIQEEIECCQECEVAMGNDYCRGCGTYGNIKDLQMQYEKIQKQIKER